MLLVTKSTYPSSSTSSSPAWCIRETIFFWELLIGKCEAHEVVDASGPDVATGSIQGLPIVCSHNCRHPWCWISSRISSLCLQNWCLDSGWSFLLYSFYASFWRLIRPPDLRAGWELFFWRQRDQLSIYAPVLLGFRMAGSRKQFERLLWQAKYLRAGYMCDTIEFFVFDYGFLPYLLALFFCSQVTFPLVALDNIIVVDGIYHPPCLVWSPNNPKYLLDKAPMFPGCLND